jgi:Fe-S-cluster containining protein
MLNGTRSCLRPKAPIIPPRPAFMSIERLPLYECDRCGACCGAYLIFASTRDAEREPRITTEAQKLAPWLETPRWAYRLHPLPFHDSCCFLGDDARCTIYETRPEVCREFAAGDQPCQQARAMRNLPPLNPIDAPCRHVSVPQDSGAGFEDV